MKLAAKIFLIISIVACALNIGACLLFGNAMLCAGISMGGWGAIAGMAGIILLALYGAMCLPCLIISIIALIKLNAAKAADDISIAFKIVVLLFGNLVSGIILLCMNDDEDYIDKKDKQNQPLQETADFEERSHNSSQRINDLDILVKYKELLDMGAITQDEYDKKKQEILNR